MPTKSIHTLLYCFFIFSFIPIKSQQIIVVDSLDDRPIPFAKIFDSKNLYLTDSAGRYNFENLPNEQVYVSSSGYQIKKVKITDKTIKLSPKITNIEAVVIDNKPFNIDEEIGFNKSKNSIIIDYKREFAIELNNLTNKNCKLESLVIPFKKSSYQKGYLLFDFYESIDGKIGQKINMHNYVVPISSLERNHILTLKEKIYMEKQSSIFVSVIWVENTYNKSESFTNKVYFYTKQNSTEGRMYVRKSNYNGWDLKPYIEDGAKPSIIPAFKALIKCTN